MRIKNQLMYIMFLAALLSAQENQMAIDGLAAIVDNNIILKSDVAQLVQMTAIQQRINPELEPERLVNLQKDILQSMVDQKIILEMAKLDSIEVKEKEVDQA
ncbi:MAG: SurA N-terminal domain-containing protein, partial [Candidatus Marinimicrobia bacterium]|nr:SurA N-terminal domain-containing protein [Candidatus Neomarinimicrobiota bacterium]